MRAVTLSQTQRDAFAPAVEHAWCAAWGSLRYDTAIHVDDTAQHLRICTPRANDLLLNAVLRYRAPHPVTRRDIDAVIAPYRAAHIPFQWWVRLGSEPLGLRNELAALGMQAWSTFPGMVLPLNEWQPTVTISQDIVVRPVTTVEEMTIARNLICQVFSIQPEPMRHWCGNNPAFTVYLATIGNAAVGAMTSQVDAGVAGFFHVATAQRWRNLGVAYAMMTEGLVHTRAQGAQIAALTASPMAESLYHDLGFQDVCSYEFWMPSTRYMESL